MRRDAFIWSVIAGVLSAVIYGLVRLGTIKLGLQQVAIWDVAGGVFLRPEEIPTPMGAFIGWIAHLIIGGMWGVVFYILLLVTGKDKWFSKGILAGFYIWTFGTLMMRMGLTSYTFFEANEQLFTLMDALIFGASLGYLVPRMAMQDVPDSESIVSVLLHQQLASPAYKHEPEENDADMGKKR